MNKVGVNMTLADIHKEWETANATNKIKRLVNALRTLQMLLNALPTLPMACECLRKLMVNDSSRNIR